MWGGKTLESKQAAMREAGKFADPPGQLGGGGGTGGGMSGEGTCPEGEADGAGEVCSWGLSTAQGGKVQVGGPGLLAYR